MFLFLMSATNSLWFKDVCVEWEREGERKCGKILRFVNLEEGYRGILCTVLATVQQIWSIIKRKKLPKQNRIKLMFRIVGQKYPSFQCTWIMKQVATVTPVAILYPQGKLAVGQNKYCVLSGKIEITPWMASLNC